MFICTNMHIYRNTNMPYARLINLLETKCLRRSTQDILIRKTISFVIFTIDKDGEIIAHLLLHSPGFFKQKSNFKLILIL